MAETTYTTIQRRAPFLEAGQEAYVDLLTQQVGRAPGTEGVPTLAELGPQVAPTDLLSQQARQAAATQAGLGALSFDPTTGTVTGVGAGTGVAGYEPYLQASEAAQARAAGLTGPTAYQAFMSPYQQDVISTTLAEFDRQRQIQEQTLAAGAVAAGAFGGGREGVQLAEYGAQSDLNRAALQAQLLQQGFGQAQSAAAQAFQQQQALGEAQRGLASLQPSLAATTVQQLGAAGTAELAQQQALLNAQQQQAQLAYQEPLNRIQALGSGLASIAGGVPLTTTQQQPAAATPGALSQAVATAAGAYGLGSIFGV